MPSLRDLQDAFAREMRVGHAGVAAAVVSDRIAAENRLRIYRNHHAVTLVDALAATYPVVEQLVGARFFRWAAGSYIDAFPPAGPCLFEYGAGFSGVLAGLAACRELPYLPDVARFEWALNRAYHAPDTPPLDPQALLGAAPVDWAKMTLDLHPSCSLIDTRYPVSRIWQANQPDSNAAACVDLGAGAERLLVCRIADVVVWRALDPGEFRFLSALRTGRRLGTANTAATATGAFDLAATLLTLFRDHLLTGFSVPSHQPLRYCHAHHDDQRSR
jgi:hypothetical protein